MKTILIKKQFLIVTAGALIIGFFGGISFGSLFLGQSGGGLSRAQVEKVKKFFPVIEEMRSFYGTVNKIDNNTITLEIPESSNPFDEWPTSRRVTVANTTKIVRVSQKTVKEFQKEMEAYSPKVGGDPLKYTQVPPPNLNKEEIIKLSDIKVGDIISVEADHNIKNETQFTATKISISINGSIGNTPPPAGLPVR